ncbi:MAG TPA: DNA methyltransferase [Gemmataceae bacterium]|nr:DNA methyltransferase [Gemmataceae bacterium]
MASKKRRRPVSLNTVSLPAVSERLAPRRRRVEPQLAPAVTQPGDLWLLGEHRLLCGDSARALLPGRAVYVWGGYGIMDKCLPLFKETGLHFSQVIIWDKVAPVITWKDFMGVHEWCFYGWREGAPHQFFGPRNVQDIWRVKKVPVQSMIHLTEKPVELAVRAIQCSSRSGENVLDLFGGSGSTLIAAEQVGRRAFLMEIDPWYCDLIVQRFERVAGRKAERIAAGEEIFAAVGASEETVGAS